MKERPILFSAPMVRAILAGTKTQTRRALKVQPTVERGDGAHRGMLGHPELAGLFAEHVFGYCYAKMARCPYGVPGDQLWVREGVRRVGVSGLGCSEFIADHTPTVIDTWPWKRNALPAIHMPRGVCRLELEITGTRVERLHGISEADAKAEGVDCHHYAAGADRPTYAASFGLLWRDINGVDSWTSNPWVWVVEFRVESQERAP